MKRNTKHAELNSEQLVVSDCEEHDALILAEWSDQSILDRPLRVYNLAIYGKIKWKRPNHIRVMHPTDGMTNIDSAPQVDAHVGAMFDRV